MSAQRPDYLVYERIFQWITPGNRWEVVSEQPPYWVRYDPVYPQMYTMRFACSDYAIPPGWGPPWMIYQRWNYFKTTGWELVQEESNFPLGPHSCSGPDPGSWAG